MDTILIVDDNAANRDFLTTVLRNRGYRLLEAEDGEQALTLALREQPKLVITDVVMPRLDGYSLARRLAQYPQLAATQVIVCTAAYEEHEARKLLQHCGVCRFITKPCEPEFVLDLVEDALRESRPRVVAEPSIAVADVQLELVNDKLLQKITELEQLQAGLEERVQHRTRELQREVQRRLEAQEALNIANRRLREDALRDSLTGLYNRRYLDHALRREIAQATRHERSFSLLLIDLDHFKECNDRLGHVAGDILLRAAARHLLSTFRAEDTVCRYGGDEFVVLMPGSTPAQARDCANRLRERIHELQIVKDGVPLPRVTLSIGVAGLTASRSTPQAMLQAADRALYRVKRAGRDQVQLPSDYVGFDATPREPASAQTQ